MKKHWKLLCICCMLFFWAAAQETFPVNGVADERAGYFAFTNATIVANSKTILQNATLVIKQGKIVQVGTNINVPKEAVVIDCKGKYIYPSFIDVFTGYGINAKQSSGGNSFGEQPLSNTKGAYGWNQSIKSETDAVAQFTVNDTKANELRGIGFGTVVSHVPDGIARGTGTVVTLGSEKDNLVVLKEKAAAYYSFSSGSSGQDYPGSLMGSVALLRQTFLDAQWYKNKPATEGTNLSLQAWNNSLSLPQIFDAGGKWNDLRADKIGDEFGVQYIIKAGGDEYQRLAEMKLTNASFILPLNFPKAMDVEDPNDARLAAVSDLKHWELAPSQPGAFEKQSISFALTTDGLESKAEFLSNLRKAIQYGLSEGKALDALTKTPASLLGIDEMVGSLDKGKLASFIITSGPVFDEKTIFFQNWIRGIKYTLKEEGWNDLRGVYTLTIKAKGSAKNYETLIKGTPAKLTATIKGSSDTAATDLNLSVKQNLVGLGWTEKGKQNLLNGIIGSNVWSGNGYLANGEVATWTLQYKNVLPPDTSKTVKKEDTKRKDSLPVLTDINFPFNGYGWKEVPKQEDLLIQNTTVWTNEKEGKLEHTDVLISKGKIIAIGKGLKAGNAKLIDGAGKHLTAGIIDEHSHIAVTGGVNECSQSVTAEVRIADVINPEDINIYRQLAGGVTSAHVLHGSCNTIGGQTQLIKLRWGKNAEDLKFANWDPFIKFALGENVKRSYSRSNSRFPDSRMGVEQVLTDAFERAKDYQKEGIVKRRDLELETLSEILNHKRFITCHSYVQSEINMLIKLADKYGFTVNTFTHILEGYKVADKMKAHGAAASTFSDWWSYKMEVQDAVAYNAAIMQKVGITVAINSDDAEQARHLNQEAAKTITYGDVSEEEALKMATLNPAIMLHVADRVGSIKIGKDADLVLWNDHPLSIYAKPLKTLVDGVVYYDVDQDVKSREYITTEKARLIQKLVEAKKNGGNVVPVSISYDELNECEVDYHHATSILVR